MARGKHEEWGTGNEVSRVERQGLQGDVPVSPIRSFGGASGRVGWTPRIGIGITADAIRHIKDHHGNAQKEVLRGQMAMAPEDVLLIPYILNNFDDAVRVPESDMTHGEKAVEIRKQINGLAIVAAIEQGRDKQFVVSGWKRVSAASMLRNASPKLNVRSAADIANVQRDISEIKRKARDVSKVVDENGEPLVVWHGTNAEFWEFDPSRVGENYGIDEEGFFFTNDQVDADNDADDKVGMTETGEPRTIAAFLKQAVRRFFGRDMKMGDLGAMDPWEMFHQVNRMLATGQRLAPDTGGLATEGGILSAVAAMRGTGRILGNHATNREVISALDATPEFSFDSPQSEAVKRAREEYAKNPSNSAKRALASTLLAEAPDKEITLRNGTKFVLTQNGLVSALSHMNAGNAESREGRIDFLRQVLDFAKGAIDFYEETKAQNPTLTIAGRATYGGREYYATVTLQWAGKGRYVLHDINAIPKNGVAGSDAGRGAPSASNNSGNAMNTGNSAP